MAIADKIEQFIVWGYDDMESGNTALNTYYNLSGLMVHIYPKEDGLGVDLLDNDYNTIESYELGEDYDNETVLAVSREIAKNFFSI